MYREEILDHYKNPRNSGKLEGGEEAKGENPNCGDECRVYLSNYNGVISEMKHETDGCAISTAAASVLSEEISGMEVDEFEELGKSWMLEKLGIEVSPMRLKCAMLPLKTAQEALKE